MRKNKVFRHQRPIRKEKIFDKNAVKILVVLVIIQFIYRAFFETKTIGHDNRYTLFIFLLPNLIGISILGYYRRSFIKKRLLEDKRILVKSFWVLFFLFQGFMFSYLSIGLAAEATLNNINKNTSRQSLNESFYCKITDFHKGTRSSRPHFWFLFHNKLEVIYSDYNSLKYYLENPSENYNVVLKAQKGVWNYYVVKDWRIEAAD